MLYLAENLATMEYKVQDEPMSVVQFLGSVIVSSSQLASLLESGHVVGEANDSIEGKMLEVQGVRLAINDLLTLSLPLVTSADMGYSRTRGYQLKSRSTQLSSSLLPSSPRTTCWPCGRCPRSQRNFHPSALSADSF